MSVEVKEDHLRFLRQPCEVGLELGLVANSGSTVQQHDGGPLARLPAFAHERRPVDVKSQACPVHLGVHTTSIPVLTNTIVPVRCLWPTQRIR
jgi:hypothetical protein